MEDVVKWEGAFETERKGTRSEVSEAGPPAAPASADQGDRREAALAGHLADRRPPCGGLAELEVAPEAVPDQDEFTDELLTCMGTFEDVAAEGAVDETASPSERIGSTRSEFEALPLPQARYRAPQTAFGVLGGSGSTLLSAIKERTPGMVRLQDEVIASLRSKVRGEVLLPGAPGFDAARTVWNAMIDRKPAEIDLVGRGMIRRAQRIIAQRNRLR
jgi:hypothetical protein